ncbi:hypothetical protein BRADI_4g13451v3 [Brachypodium distachyon]|uniref:Uncharacterized protein n=1 Tax=Brachypodium distachyon TaxID=15368 RepID=A0A2K2CMJ0_BRADI|nr:hypothetical protein BRADI_4g13451v3 [Brachypodium distachyon]
MVGSLKCVKLLLEAGADVDGNCKETPLMFAASNGGFTDILKCLVLVGADANVLDSLLSCTTNFISRTVQETLLGSLTANAMLIFIIYLILYHIYVLDACLDRLHAPALSFSVFKY